MFSLHKRSEVLILLMLFLSVSLYGLEYLLFGQVREIGFGFLGNLAFLPIYVLFVTFMIERILKQRDKDVLRQKMNMVIGVFFSEVGTPFLRDGFAFLVDKEGWQSGSRSLPSGAVPSSRLLRSSSIAAI